MFNVQLNIRVVLYSVLVMAGLDYAATTSESVNLTTVDGTFLLNLGIKYDDALLKLVGTAVLTGKGEVDKNLTDMLCRYHPCTEWGAWGDCSVKHGYGMANRSRICNRTQDNCTIGDQIDLTTTDRKVCETTCPWHYNNTDGFCLKLKENEVYADAVQSCGNDGADLVHLNSKTKSDAVYELAKENSVSSLWINGHRTSASEPWTYTVGPVSNYTNWAGEEPANDDKKRCKQVKIDPSMKWLADECDWVIAFVCEIQM